jgi:sulfur-oxidizing protein SoxA
MRVWGTVLATALLASAPAASVEKRSGYADLGPQTRAMQDDDGANPAFLWVGRGEALWRERPQRADGRGRRRSPARAATARPPSRCAGWPLGSRPGTRRRAG